MKHLRVPKPVRAYLALAAAFLVGTGICVLVADDGDVIVRSAPVVDGPGQLESHAGERLENSGEAPGAEAAAIKANVREQAQAADEFDRLGPLANPGETGCRVRFNRNNVSSRNGAKILLEVAHRTVSRNQPGWIDVYSVADYLDRSSTQASAHAIVDGEGHCLLTVPDHLKAWTAGFFIPWGYQIEFIGMPTDRITDAQWDRGAAVFARVARENQVPPRKAIVNGYRIVRSGILDHNALDCGNGHTDITPYTVAPLIQRVKALLAPVPKIPRIERAIPRGACHPKGTGHTRRYWRVRARRRIATLTRLARKSGWKKHQRGLRRKQLALAAGRC
jgi:hypothetical protein